MNERPAGASSINVDKIKGIAASFGFKATLEAIAAGHQQGRIDELLPWDFTPSS
jgi:hypothetical protein